MDMKQIKELMAVMDKFRLKKARIKDDKGFEVELETHAEHLPQVAIRQEPAHHFAPTSSTPHRESKDSAEDKPVGEYVCSPMVGTFYSAPSPDDPVYIKVGDQVNEETVVCIIEAMKVMNEVKAGKKGTVAEILVDNADAVEYGSRLFRIV